MHLLQFCYLLCHAIPGVTSDDECRLPDFLQNDPADENDYWRFKVTYRNEFKRIYFYEDRLVRVSEFYDNYGETEKNVTCVAEVLRDDNQTFYMFTDGYWNTF